MKISKIFSQIDIAPADLNIPQDANANDTTIGNILGLVFIILAAVAFIVIILAGIQFILSRGDPGKTATARSAIIYAAVGLILSATAFSIVRFFVGRL